MSATLLSYSALLIQFLGRQWMRCSGNLLVPGRVSYRSGAATNPCGPVPRGCPGHSHQSSRRYQAIRRPARSWEPWLQARRAVYVVGRRAVLCDPVGFQRGSLSVKAVPSPPLVRSLRVRRLRWHSRLRALSGCGVASWPPGSRTGHGEVSFTTARHHPQFHRGLFQRRLLQRCPFLSSGQGCGSVSPEAAGATGCVMAVSEVAG